MTTDRDPDKTCTATNSRGEPCEAWRVSGRDKCYHHLGTSPDGSSHANNGNAAKHNLTADPKKYHARQPDAEREWIRDISATIEDRIRRVRGDVDPLDRTLARRIAIKLHIAAKASEYVDETGLVQEIFVEDGGYTKEIPNGIVSELRQYDREIWNELKKLGLVDDPESQTADAFEGVIAILSEERSG